MSIHTGIISTIVSSLPGRFGRTHRPTVADIFRYTTRRVLPWTIFFVGSILFGAAALIGLFFS